MVVYHSRICLFSPPHPLSCNVSRTVGGKKCLCKIFFFSLSCLSRPSSTMSFILFLKIDYLINEKDCNIAQKRSSKLKLKIRKLKSKKRWKENLFKESSSIMASSLYFVTTRVIWPKCRARCCSCVTRFRIFQISNSYFIELVTRSYYIDRFRLPLQRKRIAVRKPF